MPIRRTTPEQEAAALNRLEALVKERLGSAADAPDPKNVRAAAELLTTQPLTIGDPPHVRQYLVPPVPFVAGLELLALHHEALRLQKWLSDHTLYSEYTAHLVRLADKVWSLIEPVHPGERALKRMGFLRGKRNPLRRQTETTLHDLVSFCLLRRMTSSARSPYLSDTVGLGVAKTNDPRTS